jgi:hypothetical protein
VRLDSRLEASNYGSGEPSQGDPHQGAEVQANFDKPEKTGGGSGEADFIFGHGDLASDGYNFTITGSYSRQQELRATQRAFSAAGFDPVRGVPNTNYPGSWPGNVVDSNGNLWQSGFPTLGTGPNNQGPQRTVGSYSLWDAYVLYRPIPKLAVLLGVKNPFDKNPPFTNAQQNNFAAGYNALVADPLLRNFYVNLKYTFF